MRVTRAWRGTSLPAPETSYRPIIGGTWDWTDYALPVTEDVTEITYTLDAYSASGQLLDTTRLTTSVGLAGHSDAWLSDPLDPLAAIRVQVLAAGGGHGWSSSGRVVSLMGGRAISLGQSRAREREWLLGYTPADSLALTAMLDRGADLLLRADPDCVQHPTGVCYLAVTDARLLPGLPHTGDLHQAQLRAIEVLPPLRPVAVPAWSYADTSSTYPTYAATRAALPYYRDRSRGRL